MSADASQPDATNPSLLRRIRSRDNKQAWNQFDELYRPMLRRFAAARGLPEADVDDVVQHCMTAVYVHIDGFTYDPQRGRFKGWLRTLVNNRCRDLLRAKMGLTFDAEKLDEVPSAHESPEDAFERIWADEHLNHCLRTVQGEVSQKVFGAFRRYALESQPAEEVCRDFGITPNQLYKLKHQLTHRLRELMEQMIGRSHQALVADDP